MSELPGQGRLVDHRDAVGLHVEPLQVGHVDQSASQAVRVQVIASEVKNLTEKWKVTHTRDYWTE